MSRYYLRERPESIQRPIDDSCEISCPQCGQIYIVDDNFFGDSGWDDVICEQCGYKFVIITEVRTSYKTGRMEDV